MKHFFIAVSALSALSACGGGGGQGFGPISQTRGHATPVQIVDNETRVVTFSKPDGTGKTGQVTLTRDRNKVVDGFQTFGGSPDEFMLFESIGGTGIVQVKAQVDDTHNNPDQFKDSASGFSAGGNTPTKGTAQYGGKYAGFLTRGSSTSNPGLTQSYIGGDVTMTADFSKNEVSGVISNRNRYLTSNGAVAGSMGNITLGAHSISGGQSVGQGATAGGRVPGNRFLPAAGDNLQGNWSVAFGGADAIEAGGLVEVNHDYLQGNGLTPDDYVETGGFVASKQ